MRCPTVCVCVCLQHTAPARAHQIANALLLLLQTGCAISTRARARAHRLTRTDYAHRFILRFTPTLKHFRQETRSDFTCTAAARLRFAIDAHRMHTAQHSTHTRTHMILFIVDTFALALGALHAAILALVSHCKCIEEQQVRKVYAAYIHSYIHMCGCVLRGRAPNTTTHRFRIHKRPLQHARAARSRASFVFVSRLCNEQMRIVCSSNSSMQ